MSSICAALRSRAGRCGRDRLLAVNSNPKPGDLPGQETREPAFDSPAKWITPDLQAQAIAAGYAVVDHTSVLAAHLSELIKQNAHDLLTRAGDEAPG